uniref:MATH domain-containing protein n=1 Tax=Caenorhabditis tropicalis TaxID=1561998 RepID=A0A1I7TR91_9PELO
MSSSQLVSHEKLYVFDRDGYLSSPIVREIHGMTWRISFELFVPRSAPPHINIKYSCENFGDKEGCYVIMKFNSRRSAQFFQINKSVFFVRKALVGFPVGPETNTHYLNEDVVNREDLHGLTLSEWKFVDPEVKEDV